MLKINQELLENFQEVYNPDPDGRDIEKERQIVDKIKQGHARKIVNLAYENTGGTFSGNVFMDPETGELHGFTWTGNTGLHPESNLVFVYKLDANWINNNAWEVNDILTDEEWQELVDKYDPDPDFLNRAQLESIDVDLDKRLIDYLIWCLTH